MRKLDPKSGADVGIRAWIRGEAILVALVVAASAVLVRQHRVTTAEADVDRALAPIAGSGELVGVRADAWFLPDGPFLGFVEIPAGPFLMGSDPTVDSLAYENERWSTGVPQATVSLPTYFIARTEVTVAQFHAFVAATGHAVDPAALQSAPEHPVTNVSWPDALAYARWLEREMRDSESTPEAISRLLDQGWRITLPDEAQWEKAARGADGRIYPWGNAPTRERANYQSSGTVPVGSYPCPECPFSVADLSGNVWEWTRSPFEPYPYEAGAPPRDLDADALWVMRGGSYTDPPANVRAATRGGADPGARRPFIGFRVVITPP